MTEAQYKAMHDGRRVVDLAVVEQSEFVIEDVGRRDDRHFQDVGIEYYRYVSGA